VVPNGLKNTPAVFQRLMQEELAGLSCLTAGDYVCIYINDILVFSKTLEEHIHHLKPFDFHNESGFG